MAQWLRAPHVLPEVLSSILSNHMVAHNHLQWDLMPSSGMYYIYTQNTHTYINKYIFFKKRKENTDFVIIVTSGYTLTHGFLPVFFPSSHIYFWDEGGVG